MTSASPDRREEPVVLEALVDRVRRILADPRAFGSPPDRSDGLDG